MKRKRTRFDRLMLPTMAVGAMCIGAFGVTNHAQAVLVAGDIAIIGYNFDDPDAFAFVALTNIAAGEQIKFTDNGWFSTGSFRANEGTLTFTAPVGGIAAGTVTTMASSGNFSLATAGDQILAYQGADASPTFIFALNSDGATWAATATSSNDSGLPPGIANANIAIPEVDNAIFNTASLATGTKAQWLAAITDTANWTTNDTTRFTMPAGPITVTGAAPPPPPPTPSTALVITGIVDGNLSGGSPKFVEVVATEDIADLSVFSLQLFSNGSTSASSTSALPSIALSAGDVFYLVSSSTNPADQLLDFNTAFPGLNAFALPPVNFNGDDTLRLVEGTIVVDEFGVFGLDGTGQPWEYTDSYAFRNSGFGPNQVFTLSEWTFGGPGALPDDDMPGMVSILGPLLGQFNTAAVIPEPVTFSMLLIGGVALMSRRQRAA